MAGFMSYKLKFAFGGAYLFANYDDEPKEHITDLKSDEFVLSLMHRYDRCYVMHLCITTLGIYWIVSDILELTCLKSNMHNLTVRSTNICKIACLLGISAGMVRLSLLFLSGMTH